MFSRYKKPGNGKSAGSGNPKLHAVPDAAAAPAATPAAAAAQKAAPKAPQGQQSGRRETAPAAASAGR